MLVLVFFTGTQIVCLIRAVEIWGNVDNLKLEKTKRGAENEEYLEGMLDVNVICKPGKFLIVFLCSIISNSPV